MKTIEQVTNLIRLKSEADGIIIEELVNTDTGLYTVDKISIEEPLKFLLAFIKEAGIEPQAIIDAGTWLKIKDCEHDYSDFGDHEILCLNCYRSKEAIDRLESLFKEKNNEA